MIRTLSGAATTSVPEAEPDRAGLVQILTSAGTAPPTGINIQGRLNSNHTWKNLLSTALTAVGDAAVVQLFPEMRLVLTGGTAPTATAEMLV